MFIEPDFGNATKQQWKEVEKKSRRDEENYLSDPRQGRSLITQQTTAAAGHSQGQDPGGDFSIVSKNASSRIILPADLRGAVAVECILYKIIIKHATETR